MDKLLTEVGANHIQTIALNYQDIEEMRSKYATNPNFIYGRIDDLGYKKMHSHGIPFYALFNSKGELIAYHANFKDYNWVTSKIK